MAAEPQRLEPRMAGAITGQFGRKDVAYLDGLNEEQRDAVLSIEGPLLVLASTEGSSGSRALSGSSCSDRKGTSRPWILRTFFSRSMHAWWALSMSKPRRRSTSRPCNEIRRDIVIEDIVYIPP